MKPLRIMFIPLITVVLFSCFSAPSTLEETSPPQTPMPNYTAKPETSNRLTVNSPLAPISTKVPPPAPAGLPPTWTALPTYSSNIALDLVINLYKNSSCELPCWWNITPGETSWLDAWQFLGRFAKNQSPWGTLLLESKDLPGYIYYQVDLGIPQPPSGEYKMLKNYLLFTIKISDFNVHFIDVDTGTIEAYSLQNIFSEYGKPSEMYVMAYESPLASGMTLYMYYPKDGFISTQFVNIAHENWTKPRITVCFQNTEAGLSLWPQKENINFYDRLKIQGVDPYTLKLIKPLEEVTSLDLNQLYKNLSNVKHPCLEFDTKRFETP